MEKKEIIFIVEESPDGGWVAEALGEDIITQGDSLEELKENIKDALECHFGDKDKIPRIIHLHIVRDEVLMYEEATERRFR